MKNDTISLKEEEKYIKAISKLIEKVPLEDRYDNIDKNPIRVFDPFNVFMIESISNDAKSILEMFCPKGEMQKEINLNYKEKIGKTRFSTEYLYKIMNIFKHDDYVDILMSKNMPVTISNKHFKVILAPRGEI